jgi:hypothetical protein
MAELRGTQPNPAPAPAGTGPVTKNCSFTATCAKTSLATLYYASGSDRPSRLKRCNHTLVFAVRPRKLGESLRSSEFWPHGRFRQLIRRQARSVVAIPVPVSGCQNTPQHEHQSPSSISTCTAIADWYATPKNAVEACICCVLSCYPNILSWVASGRSLVLPLELNALALGNFSIRLGGVNGRRLSESMSLALWLGNIPPNRREMLKSERLPQTRQ